MREYQAEFEKLSAHVKEWPEAGLIGNFIGGLKNQIQCKIKMFKPATLTEAIGLACLQEDKIQHRCNSFGN